MEKFLKGKISLSILVLTLLLQGWDIFGSAPQGCSYITGAATCDFQTWTPSLRDIDFGPDQLYSLRLENINGPIPEGAFSGLNGPNKNGETYIYLVCNEDKTRLLGGIFTKNLHWVTELQIYFCIIENGLPSRLLENLTSLNYFAVSGSRIEGLVARDTLAGLTNLQRITINTQIEDGKLPPGLFDGLNNLTLIDLRFARLNVICPNWFDGLVTLQTIYLYSNNLQTLPQGLFDELISLKNVDLRLNPWNCSCELTWLLDWSNITDRGKCRNPLHLQNVELENALGMLNCTRSTPKILSTSSATEVNETINQTITETRTLPSLTFTADSMPMSITVASFIITSITKAAPTISLAASTTNNLVGTETFAGLLPIISARSVSVKASLYSTTPMANFRLTNKDDSLNHLRKLIVISAIGTVVVFLTVATILYLCVCRNKCIASVNPVNYDGENRQNLNLQ